MKFVILVLALTISACATDGMDDTQSAPKSLGSAKACEACTNDRDCAAGLSCHQGVWVCKSQKQYNRSTSRGWPAPAAPQCDADCKAKECPYSGMCHLRDGKCVALTDADCEQSKDCKENKQCKAKSWGGCG